MKTIFHSRGCSRSRRGVALLLVIWALAFLSVTIFGVIEMVLARQEDTVGLNRELRASQLAESGLAIGLHPAIQRGDDLLNHEVRSSEGWEVKLSTEESRLQINQLLTSNGKPSLIDLFEKWGLKDDEASAVVDGLMDWVDADDLSHLNGAERDYYREQGHPEYPRNASFQSVDEMALVRGMDVVAEKKPDWMNCFTIWGDGKLDVNEASAELIQAVCGVTSEQAEAAVQRRAGSQEGGDAKPETRFKTLEEFRLAIGLDAERFNKVQGRLTVEGVVRRIESTGRIGQHKKTIVLVTRRGAQPNQYLAWIEP